MTEYTIIRSNVNSGENRWFAFTDNWAEGTLRKARSMEHEARNESKTDL